MTGRVLLICRTASRFGRAGRAAILLLATPPAMAQQSADYRVARIEIRPDSVELRVGERVVIDVTARDRQGQPVSDVLMLVSSQGAEASYDHAADEIVGLAAGKTTVSARVRRPAAGDSGFEEIRATVVVVVKPASVTRLEIDDLPAKLYVGTRSRLRARAWAGESIRGDAILRWRSSDDTVLEVGAGGLLRAVRPGVARITVDSEGITRAVDIPVVANPIRGLAVTPERTQARAGDVVRFRAEALDAEGGAVRDVDVEWTWAGLSGQPYDALWLASEDGETGAAVASDPGAYRVTASVGSVWRDVELQVRPRPGRRKVARIAHGVVPRGHATTDLWVFEGMDGRDYVYTGTYSSNLMYSWDVTDPARPVITDSVAFDGRRVNDVKINGSRTLAVVTSENAATRRNGLTLLDVRDPAHPRRVSHFTDGLTGGVHNTWIEVDLVYAVHYGTRAVHIIDISDPAAPRQVGRWNLPNEDRFLHDVSVMDGLAYLSYWNDGVVILDVGAGVSGGTPVEPQLVSRYRYSYRLGPETYGNTHHAIRYRNYVFTADEIFDCAECINGPRGYVHVIDVSDIANPREVAWYRVPEAGVHNLWAEDDKLYIGYYQAGLRVLDIAGELRGDLYRQGREIGWYMTEDAEGTTPNATDTWGAQPYKGKIFASDGNSGLWIVELQEPTSPMP